MSEKRKIEKRYDAWSRWYDAVDTNPLFGGKAQERWRREAIGLLELKKGESVIDLGTGTGLILPWISESCKGAHVVGIDISGKMLLRARKKGCADLVRGDLDCMPFKDSSLDKAIATFTLTTAPDPVAFLKDTARVLKDDGILVILDTGKPKKKGARAVHALISKTAKLSGHTKIDRDPYALLGKVPEMKIEKEKRYYGGMVYAMKIRKFISLNPIITPK
ncbi:MAG: methyltransferase domain-containing protein [Euryarchaeota archaeon]|nr:methyltransferase domain-containing protein [Euryarchaeota archaeon]